MVIDTHCHLDFKDFDADRDAVIDRARKAGVGTIINVASSIDGTRRSVELAKRYEMVYASIGVHPHEAASVSDQVIEDFKALAKEPKVVAVGEVGLDYYRNLAPKDIQIDALIKFIHLADSLDLPIIIHSREADADIISILNKEKGANLQGVVHCFSGDEQFLKACLDLGFFISFTCNLTFKNASALREVAAKVPVERLLLETDAPYLAPQALRGKRNEPAFLTYLIEEWARILHLSKDDIERITTHNANTLFRLDIDEPTRYAYPIRDSIYLNITNKCTSECTFCIRSQTAFVKGHNLKLEREPSVDDILKAIGDPAKYKEIVFCGYGEPTIRLEDMKSICTSLKKKGARIRLVTNGHADLIHGRPIVPELIGLIDRVSVSLNAENEEKYISICKPKFGPGTYAKVMDFIKACVAGGIATEVTCLDLEGVDTDKCKRIAESMGAHFRLRSFGVVG